MIRSLVTAATWLAGTAFVGHMGLNELDYNYLMLMGLALGVVAYAVGQAFAQWIEA